MNYTMETIEAWLDRFTEVIEQNKQVLSDLDTPIGDGDHGNNMARGVKAYQEEKEKKAPESIADVFKTMAMAMISKVGGASGPLYGSAFMAMAQASKAYETLDTAELAAVLEAGALGIKKRGKAELEEKTMLDVWWPCVEELKENQLTEEKITAYVHHTKELVAKKGRASYLGERAIGHIDPGAQSSGYLFETLIK